MFSAMFFLSVIQCDPQTFELSNAHSNEQSNACVIFLIIIIVRFTFTSSQLAFGKNTL